MLELLNIHATSVAGACLGAERKAIVSVQDGLLSALSDRGKRVVYDAEECIGVKQLWHCLVRDVSVYGIEYDAFRPVDLNFNCHPGVHIHLRLCGSGTYAIDTDHTIHGCNTEFQFFSSLHPWTKRVMEVANIYNRTVALGTSFESLKYYIGPSAAARLVYSSKSVTHFRRPINSSLREAAESLLSLEVNGGLTDLIRDSRIREVVVCCFQSLIEEQEGDKPRVRIRLRDEEKIAEAADILQRNLAAPPTIPNLARQVGLNTCKLKHAFKSIKGCPIGEFIRDARLTRAARMLREDLDVETTAYDVGYLHAGNFARLFRARFGMNPRAYREKYRRSPAKM